mmetsp:Transcript_2917/g.5682  ORF Transcript_2917/g.5682 Transcript_2917/m.5682 type:complete len:410 (-) Transcript_2917:21-1250(-)
MANNEVPGRRQTQSLQATPVPSYCSRGGGSLLPPRCAGSGIQKGSKKNSSSGPIAEWQENTGSRKDASRIRLSELLGSRGPPQFRELSAGPDAQAISELSGLFDKVSDKAGTASTDTASTLNAEASQASEREEFDHGSQQFLIRVIDPVKRSRRVETKRTVAAYLLGEGSKLENTLFKWAVQNWKTSRLLWSLWVSGAIFGLLTLLECIPLELVWFSILMLPLPGFTSLVLSVDLLKEVIEQFEFYLVSILQVALAVGAVIMLQDRRAVFWFCYSPTMIIATFIDAYPPRYRSRFSRMFFSAMIGMLIFWTCTLTFGLIRIRDIHWQLAYLEGRCASMSCHMMLTLTAFCCKHLFFAIWKPDHLVIIRNPTRTLHVPVRKEEVCHERDGKVTQKYIRLDRQLTNLSLSF